MNYLRHTSAFRYLKEKIRFVERSKLLLVNSAWLFAGKAFCAGGDVFINVHIARYLGPGKFGQLSYAVAFVALLAPLSAFGTSQIVIREIISQEHDNYEILGSAFVIRAFTSLMTVISCILLVKVIEPQKSLLILLVSITAVGLMSEAFRLIEIWFESQSLSKNAVVPKNIAFLLSFAIKIILIKMQAPLVAFAGVIVLDAALYTLLLLTVYRRTGQLAQQWICKTKIMKKMLRDGIPFLISSMAIVLYMKVDQIMLGNLYGNREVGIYSAAVKMCEMSYILPFIISTSVTPIIMKLRATDYESYKRRLCKTLNFMAVLAYAVSILLSTLSSHLPVLLFGDEYYQSGAIVSIYAWASVFVFLGGIREIWIVSEGLAIASMKATILGVVVNISLNAALIPQYQGIGATIATLISYTTSAYLSCFIFSELKPMAKPMTRAVTITWVLNKNKHEF